MACIALLAGIVQLVSTANAGQLAGWVENVSIHPGNIQVKAKLDTGAKYSSLSCDCSATFMKGDVEWVRFSVTGHKGEILTFERRVLRRVQIKRHFGDKQRRVVVRLGICLGGTYQDTEVTLIDRAGFNYSMLLGRDFMAGHVFVDPGSTFRTSPSCGNAVSGP